RVAQRDDDLRFTIEVCLPAMMAAPAPFLMHVIERSAACSRARSDQCAFAASDQTSGGASDSGSDANAFGCLALPRFRVVPPPMMPNVSVSRRSTQRQHTNNNKQ